MLTPSSNVALLGFGARAARLAALLAPRGCALRAWDVLLTDADDSGMRARIEAAGVDPIARLADALRGARLVVLDTAPMTSQLTALLQPGQQLLDLANAPDTDLESVLLALGVPAAAARACIAEAAGGPAMAHSAAADSAPPVVRRGELP